MPVIASEPEALSNTPIGWFAMVFPESNLWQGYFLYSIVNGQFALDYLAEADLVTRAQADGALHGDERCIGDVISVALKQLALLFATDPASRATIVYGSMLAYLIEHPFFLIEYRTNDIRFVKISKANTIDEARQFASEYPAVKAMENTSPTVH
jgi:hypothetical protein